jgi:hypothetical protein
LESAGQRRQSQSFFDHVIQGHASDMSISRGSSLYIRGVLLPRLVCFQKQQITIIHSNAPYTPPSVMTRQSLARTSLEDLDNDDRVRVLGIIDKFRELGINEDISLPQVGN